MANTKISQLPLYSGTAADLRWFVMNNSGETETFKFSGYTSPFKTGSGNNSVINVYYPPSSALSPYSTLIGGTGNSIIGGTDPGAVIIGGNNNTLTSSTSSTEPACGIFAAYDSTISNSPYGSTIVGGWNCDIINSAYASTIIGSNDSQIRNGSDASTIINSYSSNIDNADHNLILGGYALNIINGASYSTIINGQSNTIGTNTSQTTITAGYNNSVQTSVLGFYAGTQDNTVTSAGVTFALIGGGYNTVTNNSGAGNGMYSSYFCSDTTANDTSVIGSSCNVFYGSRNCSMSGPVKHNSITNSYNSSITNNPTTDVREWFNKIDSAESSQMVTSKSSQIIGGLTNVLTRNDYSAIIGGTGNTMSSSIYANNGKGNYIINSKNCKVEKDGQYQSNNVNYIGCDNIQTENLNDVTFINVKDVVLENGGIATGTTIFRNTLTIGATTFQADTYTSTGATTNIVIDPRQQDYIQINTDGSTTYNISFTFVDSAIYSSIHLYISYVSGSTVNFVNGANTQWRWNNNTAPVFSGTNRNIIVMSTWANDDVWEVSRSMYMS